MSFKHIAPDEYGDAIGWRDREIKRLRKLIEFRDLSLADATDKIASLTAEMFSYQADCERLKAQLSKG